MAEVDTSLTANEVQPPRTFGRNVFEFSTCIAKTDELGKQSNDVRLGATVLVVGLQSIDAIKRLNIVLSDPIFDPGAECDPAAML
jgi:hypothetical protein